MRALAVLGPAVLLLALACEKELTPAERAAKDRSECMQLATSETGFDPILAEEPPRTLSSAHKRGGTLKEGAVDVGKGALGGAALGVVGGAIMGETGRGAAVGGLIGGAKHYQKRQETVTTTRPNPEYRLAGAIAGAEGAFVLAGGCSEE